MVQSARIADWKHRMVDHLTQSNRVSVAMHAVRAIRGPAQELHQIVEWFDAMNMDLPLTDEWRAEINHALREVSLAVIDLESLLRRSREV